MTPIRTTATLASLIALAACSPQAPAPVARAADVDWPFYGGDAGGQRYSTAGQVTPANVRDLKVAWTYSTGELARHDLKHAAFENTLRLVEEADLAFLHVFPYSARPGTPAARMPPVKGAVIKDRARRLREAGQRGLERHLQRQVGRVLPGLVEREGVARAEDFTEIRFEGEAPLGEIVAFTVTGHDGARVLAERAAHPLMIYNIPYRTGVNLGNDTMLQLADHGNIVGLKDCCAIREQSVELLRRRPERFTILTGEDAQYFEALEDGADGAILASAHLETGTFAAIRSLLLAGDREAAWGLWQGVAPLTQLVFAEPSPAPLKHWLWRTGLIDSAEVRLPMVGVSPELARRLDRDIERRRAGALLQPAT